MQERLVIIGAGMAATRLVDELCDVAPGRYQIAVVGAEPRLPYNRVLLSSLLAGDVNDAGIELKPASWWSARHVNLRTGCRAVSIDAQTHRVVLDDGSSLAFDRIVLATGSRALRLPLPGADLPGVLTFRDCSDVATMLAKAGRGKNVAVIGGGLLGLEAAHGLAKTGAHVTLVHVMDRLMERQLDPVAAAMLASALRARGIDVKLEARSQAILGDDRVSGLAFADGTTLAVDMVVMAVGIVPETKLAAAAGIEVRRAICVDDGMETSKPGIYALGECSEHRGTNYGLVEPAYEQARVLARRFAGYDARYEGSLLSTNLKVSGIGVFSCGEFMGAAGAQSLSWQDRGLQQYRKLVLRETPAGAVLAGAVLYGDTSDGLWYLDMIRAARPVDAIRDNLIFGRALCERKAA